MVSLFINDIRIIALTKEDDIVVDIINMILIAVFSTEIILNIATEGYFRSFYFYLDLVSTITMFLDITVLTNMIFDPTSNFQVSELATKSKASRAAARAVRIIKIFRLARVAKLYQSTKKARELNEKNRKKMYVIEHRDKVDEESKLGDNQNDYQNTSSINSFNRTFV